MISIDLLAQTQTLLLRTQPNSPQPNPNPARRLLHVAARLIHGGRRIWAAHFAVAPRNVTFPR